MIWKRAGEPFQEMRVDLSADSMSGNRSLQWRMRWIGALLLFAMIPFLPAAAQAKAVGYLSLPGPQSQSREL